MLLCEETIIKTHLSGKEHQRWLINHQKLERKREGLSSKFQKEHISDPADILIPSL
jgi:hypothetical protein